MNIKQKRHRSSQPSTRSRSCSLPSRTECFAARRPQSAAPLLSRSASAAPLPARRWPRFIVVTWIWTNLLFGLRDHSNVANVSPNIDSNVGGSSVKRVRMESICEGDIISDPALRKPINDYDPQIRDEIRRKYMVKGPCQPFFHDFVRSDFSKKSRCFQVEWFKRWVWLEYSVSKDAAFCFWCYLFKGDIDKRFGDDVFVQKTFYNWKKASEKFQDHVGASGSKHNNARTSFFAFKDQRQNLTRNVSSGKTVFYGQYKCTGAGAGAGRVSWSKELSDEEAKPFLSLSFIDGSEWIHL